MSLKSQPADFPRLLLPGTPLALALLLSSAWAASAGPAHEPAVLRLEAELGKKYLQGERIAYRRPR